jgi:Tol biopolymer transport system component
MLAHRRSPIGLLPALVVLLSLAACDNASDPLSPPDDGAAGVVEPAAADAAPAADVTTLSGTTQRIAFASSRSGGGDIYKMDPQGYSVARLTTSGSLETQPAWSKDNKRVALVRPRKDASNVSHYDIYVINADGTNGHWARSTPFPYHMQDPAWSPDGSRIAVTMIVNASYYLGYIDLPTGQVGLFNSMAGGRLGHRPSYDPTGTKIVYVGYRNQSIEQISADGLTNKVVYELQGYAMGDPTFSPDGKKIAFYRQTAYRYISTEKPLAIYVMTSAGGSVTKLTTAAGQNINPTWSPDGSKIAFASDRTGQFQIYTMTATGGSQTRITKTSAKEWYPSWTH